MTDPTNVHEPVPQSAKLTAREKKWIIYDVGNSAFVLLSTAVIPIYAKSLMATSCPPGATRKPLLPWSSRCSCRCSAPSPTCKA